MGCVASVLGCCGGDKALFFLVHFYCKKKVGLAFVLGIVLPRVDVSGAAVWVCVGGCGCVGVACSIYVVFAKTPCQGL